MLPLLDELSSSSSATPFSPFLNSTMPRPRERPTSGRRFPKSSTATPITMSISSRPSCGNIRPSPDGSDEDRTSQPVGLGPNRLAQGQCVGTDFITAGQSKSHCFALRAAAPANRDHGLGGVVFLSAVTG